MNPIELDDCVLIGKPSYEKYRKLKGFHRNACDRFGKINTLVFRLFVFVDLLNTEIYDRKEIEYNIEMTIEELYECCEKYKDMLDTPLT